MYARVGLPFYTARGLELTSILTMNGETGTELRFTCIYVSMYVITVFPRSINDQ
jgi:hypothetical protein